MDPMLNLQNYFKSMDLLDAIAFQRHNFIKMTGREPTHIALSENPVTLAINAGVRNDFGTITELMGMKVIWAPRGVEDGFGNNFLILYDGKER